MFSLRQALYSRRLYSRSFFEKLIRDLRDAGFQDIRIKLPHNIVGSQGADVSVEEFLERDRNYASLIMVAQATEPAETIKVLFVNISRKTFFMDDAFPSGHSVPSAIQVTSTDPARAYSLTKFFVDYLRGGTPSPSGKETLLWVVLAVAGLAEVLTFTKYSQGLLASRLARLWPLDILVCLLALVVSFWYSRKPSGLYINARPKQGLLQLACMALRGELRDNPLVTIVVSVVASVATAALLRLLGLL